MTHVFVINNRAFAGPDLIDYLFPLINTCKEEGRSSLTYTVWGHRKHSKTSLDRQHKGEVYALINSWVLSGFYLILQETRTQQRILTGWFVKRTCGWLPQVHQKAGAFLCIANTWSPQMHRSLLSLTVMLMLIRHTLTLNVHRQKELNSLRYLRLGQWERVGKAQSTQVLERGKKDETLVIMSPTW